MTNEDLVKLIQSGKIEYIPQLWDQVYLFICMMARKRLISEADHIKQLENDLVNEAYFEFIRAIDSYNTDKEAVFITYLGYWIKNAFNRALNIRTVKDRNNLMHHAISLDAPIDAEGEVTLQDMLIDPEAEKEYDNLLEAIRIDGIKGFVWRAVDSLSFDQRRYYSAYLMNDLNRLKTANALGISINKSRKLYISGMVSLRTYVRQFHHKKELGRLRFHNIVYEKNPVRFKYAERTMGKSYEEIRDKKDCKESS